MNRFVLALCGACLLLPIRPAHADVHSGDAFPNDGHLITIDIGSLPLGQTINLHLGWLNGAGLTDYLDQTQFSTNGKATLQLPMSTLGYEFVPDSSFTGEFFATGLQSGDFTAAVDTTSTNSLSQRGPDWQ